MKKNLLLGILLFAALAAMAAEEPLPRVYRYWESFHKADGLPADKAFSILVDGDRIWAGTESGLACYEDGKWRYYGVKEGLAYPAVLSLALDTASGDIWAGTMKGLSRFSAGRFENFTQFNSGLPNDVVFGVCVENQNVWTATTAGTARFRVREKKWDVYTPANSPQHEPWGYFVTYGDGRVYAALWGGGVLEFDVATQAWRSWLDPDGEMEYDVFRDDGLIHNITTSVSYVEKILWIGTYFGMSRYDGREWRGYMDHDSGLASNFINFVKARGRVAWACTDKGLSAVNGDTNRWVTYTPADPAWSRNQVPPAEPIEGTKGWVAKVYNDNKLLETIKLEHGLANNHIYGVDFQGDDVWVATSKGVSHGALVQKKAKEGKSHE
ncbi:MAG: regulator [Acidobacteriia bacterium]|nr:regulator [Terriglobia bacterium]